jgi:hypothetical protein
LTAKTAKKKEETMESLGARYNINQSLPPATFSNPPAKHTSQLPYEVKGNEPPRKGYSPNVFGTPIPSGENLDVTEGLPETGGRLPHLKEFNTGRNSGRTETEQPNEVNGAGTNAPAENTGAIGAGAIEAGEETSALGYLGGLAEVAALL